MSYVLYDARQAQEYEYMPKDAIKEPASSPGLDETPPVITNEVVDPADDAVSSPATQGDNDDDSLLSVVRDVRARAEEEESSDSASPADGVETEDTDDDDQTDTELPEDYSDVPFHKHPRFQQLIEERNSYREDAGQYRQIAAFLDHHGLTAEEAGNGLRVLALAKVDPVECFEQLKPWLQDLLLAAGQVLPQDLKERVANGELTKEAAFELSEARARTHSARAAQEALIQRQERTQESSRVTAVKNAADAWEADRRRKDPNFDAKRSALEREISYLLLTEGKPKTPEGVRDQLNRAYKAVNDRLPARPAPQPNPQNTVRPLSPGAPGDTRPTEMSTLDIVRANRRTAAAG